MVNVAAQTRRAYNGNMTHITLSAYIERVGDDAAAEILGIKPRTAQAYRLGFRVPRPDKAKQFADLVPELSVESIYNTPRRHNQEATR